MDDNLEKLKLVHLEGESLVTAIATSVIDSRIEECVAAEFKKDSRGRIAGLRKKRVVLQEIVRLNDHSQLYLVERNLGHPGFSNREWRSICVWKSDGRSVWSVYEDINELDKNFEVKSGNVVAFGRTTWFSNRFHSSAVSLKHEPLMCHELIFEERSLALQ